MAIDEDPFVDPVPGSEDASADRGNSFAVEDTLSVGKEASLTLGTDSLIVLDEAFESTGRFSCCGLFSSATANTRAIPFYNILWAELTDSTLTINYAAPTSKGRVTPAVMDFSVEFELVEEVNVWISKLLARAYGEARRKKRCKILVNPHSGKGAAEKWYRRDVEPLFRGAHCSIDMATTRHGGEATDIAEKIDLKAFDVIVCCSGDGLAHEVFNGLGKRPDARKALSQIAVVHIPCGSGNAMSCNLNGTGSPSLASLASIKGVPTPFDLVSITQGETRILSFLSQAVGIVAESDLATEHLRWLGPERFTYGYLLRLIRKASYPCDLAVKVAIEDKDSIKAHYEKERGNHEPASERRGYKYLLEDDASGSDGTDEGLPSLRYGTINDKLPDGWELLPHDHMGNFYCGNMAFMSEGANFFSAALPNDGLMDLIYIRNDVSRHTAIKLMLAVGNNTFFDQPEVWYRKILGYRIIPKNQNDGYISIDGERIPFAPFQAEVHKGLGTVLSKSGHMYEASGPSGTSTFEK